MWLSCQEWTSSISYHCLIGGFLYFKTARPAYVDIVKVAIAITFALHLITFSFTDAMGLYDEEYEAYSVFSFPSG